MSKLDGLVVRWLFVSTNDIKMQILGLVGFKSSTLTVYCLRSWFVHQELKTYSALFVLSGLGHLAWFQGLKFILPSFRLWVPNHYVKSRKLKKWILRLLVFYTTFLCCWKIEEKTKKSCEVYTKILICTTYRVNIWKIPPEAAKVSTLIKFFNVEKT